MTDYDIALLIHNYNWLSRLRHMDLNWSLMKLMLLIRLLMRGRRLE